MSSTTENITNYLEEMYDRYQAEVFTLADEMFYDHVLPFLKSNLWNLKTGMGSWVVTDRDGEYVDLERGTIGEMELYDILSISVPGCNASLGSFMNDYDSGGDDV